MKSTVASVVVSIVLVFPLACHASSHEIEASDAASLQQLEQRAEHAESREQAFLYTELVQVYTQVVGRQMADGEMDQANVTLQRIEHFAAIIHTNLVKNAKKLKDAEMLMHSATFHLGQYMHQVSSDDKPAVESTLKKLDKVHDELLAQVFAH